MALYFTESYCQSMFYTAEIGIFDLFAPDDRDPMTFICELELYFLQIYQMCQI